MVPEAEVCSPDITPESFLEIIWNLNYHQVSSEKNEQYILQAWKCGLNIQILGWKGSINRPYWNALPNRPLISFQVQNWYLEGQVNIWYLEVKYMYDKTCKFPFFMFKKKKNIIHPHEQHFRSKAKLHKRWDNKSIDIAFIDIAFM